MDYKNLTSLLIRLAGFFILVNAITNMPAYFTYALSAKDDNAPLWVIIFGAVLPIAIPTLVGLALIYFPRTISNKLVYDTDDVKTLVDAAPQLESIAISILGVYLLFRAVSDAVYHLSRLFIYYKVISSDISYRGIPSVLPQDFGYLIATGIEFLLAFWLILGSKGIAMKLKLSKRSV